MQDLMWVLSLSKIIVYGKMDVECNNCGANKGYKRSSTKTMSALLIWLLNYHLAILSILYYYIVTNTMLFFFCTNRLIGPIRAWTYVLVQHKTLPKHYRQPSRIRGYCRLSKLHRFNSRLIHKPSVISSVEKWSFIQRLYFKGDTNFKGRQCITMGYRLGLAYTCYGLVQKEV